MFTVSYTHAPVSCPGHAGRAVFGRYPGGMRKGGRTLAGLAVAGLMSAACATSAPRGPQPFPMRGPATAARTDVAPALAERVVASALALEGTPYRFGGASPRTGFDCSGLVSYVLGLHAIDLPRTVAEQFAIGLPVDRGLMRAGDLVFFSTTGRGATHVGLLIDGQSGPAFIHAPADGSRVRIERLDAPYWRSRWIGARRVLNSDARDPRG